VIRHLVFTLIVLAYALCATAGQQNQAANELLWDAARAGDTARIASALAQGADVNARSRYEVTALIYAAGSGRLEAVQLLVARGGDVNAQDSFYRARAADMAITNGQREVVLFLLQHGAIADDVLSEAVSGNDEPIVKAAAEGRVTRGGLAAALALANTLKRDTLATIVRVALERLPPSPSPTPFNVAPGSLPGYAGTYRDASSGLTIVVSVQDGDLGVQWPGQTIVGTVPTAPDTFRVAQRDATLTFNGRGGLIESLDLNENATSVTLVRISDPSTTPSPSAPPAAPIVRRAIGPRNWPGFRGEGSAGNGDGQHAVTSWDVATSKNVKWKTPIPGIANSSPIVWGARVFVTTAISEAGDTTFKTGLYGDVKPVDDLSQHEWKLYCLDKDTGHVLWERTAAKGVPGTKRHTKSSQASSTPVTDGRRVIAVFGSAGVLVTWDFSGKELWRVQLGTLDSGWFFDPAFQWGHASSPIIYRDSVILQADMQKGSYIAAWDLASGRPLWHTPRSDEISTWATPTIVRRADGSDELVTNGTKIRGYDPGSGRERWRLGPNSEIAIGTPVAADGVVYVTGGYPPVRPIYAIRVGATGDISLPTGRTSGGAIAWSHATEGTYIPTPLLYDGYLFTLNVNGVLTAYDPATGERGFRGRVGSGGVLGIARRCGWASVYRQRRR
jgi:outer membrane protein assembly factor BamB